MCTLYLNKYDFKKYIHQNRNINRDAETNKNQ